jgi:ubiquinone/menaquinone biosynthesis C-methylase UbiE
MGIFSEHLAARVAPGGSLDIVDVLPIQLRNLRQKLPASAPVTLHLSDSTALGFDDASYDQAILFFLLHEQPAAARRQTLREALRVVKPGGKLVLVDYHLPVRLHPLRYMFRPVLRALEPFALDLWRHELAQWLPERVTPAQSAKRLTMAAYTRSWWSRFRRFAPLKSRNWSSPFRRVFAPVGCKRPPKFNLDQNAARTGLRV